MFKFEKVKRREIDVSQSETNGTRGFCCLDAFNEIQYRMCSGDAPAKATLLLRVLWQWPSIGLVGHVNLAWNGSRWRFDTVASSRIPQ